MNLKKEIIVNESKKLYHDLLIIIDIFFAFIWKVIKTNFSLVSEFVVSLLEVQSFYKLFVGLVSVVTVVVFVIVYYGGILSVFYMIYKSWKIVLAIVVAFVLYRYLKDLYSE